jgi:DNA-binding MarR family transcriptional regulator
MFKDLDPLLHQQLRLQIMTLLMNVETAEFNYLLKETGATRGNISVQMKKLEEAGYISIKKSFRNNYPLTTYQVAEKGRQAYINYVDALESYFSNRK